MRSLVVILATIILLAGGFWIYTSMQPARSIRPHADATGARSNAPPATTPANQSLPISKGEKVFVESFDNQTGNLTRRFRGATWDPQPDGTVRVEQIEAEFFGADGQVLRVRGDRGEVVVPASGGGGGNSRESMSRAQLPTRGKIFGAHITLTPAGAKRPTLTCTVNNLSFDNDTFLLATEEFKDEAGNTVAADQVPVTIRGDEYDFDGRGLVMHWDERDQRLHLLEIAHGGTVTIKNPDAVGLSSDRSPKREATTRPVSTVARAEKAHAATIPSSVPAVASTQPVDLPSPYRATFAENVRIEQAGEQLASCDVMSIDFLMDAPTAPRESETPATTRPTTKRSPAGRASTVAATSPAQQPIRVTWTGKLSVQLAPQGVTPPSGREPIIEMASTSDRPVITKSPDGELRCASFRFNTADNSLAVRNSPTIPVITVKDATGVSITTTAFDYSGEQRVATVRGKSTAEFPVDPESKKLAKVQWSESCTLHTSATSNGARGQMSIEHALLRGDVNIDHPQMTLASRELELSFDPATSIANRATTKPASANNPQIHQMIARDQVRGRFVDPQDPNAPPQSIDTDNLTVDFAKTEDDRSHPSKAVASGAVRAGDGKSEMRANHLEVAMSPAPRAAATTTQPANRDRTADALAPVQVDSVFAQQGVRATSSDGQEIACEQLSMKNTPDGPLYTIQGEPSAPARVSDGARSLVGPIIEFSPNTQHAVVRGAGSLRGYQEVNAAAGNKPATTQPIEVTWEKELDADGKKNLITISGSVVAKSKVEDGSTAEVLGQRLTIELADTARPTAPPADRPANAATTQRSSNPFALAGAGAGGAEMNAFRDKVFKLARVESEPEFSEIRSTLLGEDGSLLRRMHLFAKAFVYDPEAKRMIVPVAGRMLYEDQLANKEAGANAQAANEKLNLRGATAFEWKRDFIYDDASRKATMSGDVDVVHRGADVAQSYRMHADRIVAELMPGDASDAKSSEAKLKSLVADGGVTFNSSQLQFTADRVEYDPQKEIILARGTERAPATLLDQSGLSQGTFAELEYDVKNDRLKLTDSRGTIRRTTGSGRGAITGSNPSSEK